MAGRNDAVIANAMAQALAQANEVMQGQHNH
jgi:hypothetical protein